MSSDDGENDGAGGNTHIHNEQGEQWDGGVGRYGGGMMREQEVKLEEEEGQFRMERRGDTVGLKGVEVEKQHIELDQTCMQYSQVIFSDIS